MTAQMREVASTSSPLKSVAASASTESVRGNFRGLFADDWATEDKITMLAETYTVFSSLQKIATDEAQRQRTAAMQNRASIAAMLPSVQSLQYYRRISELYRAALKRYIGALEAVEPGSGSVEEEVDLELRQWLHAIMHFVETIYVPADGRGAGVVGEEILHWLNSFDFAPQTEEGQEIAQSAVPHEHPSYWSYVLRCVLRGFHKSAASLLMSLSNAHSSPVLQKVAQRASKLLSSMPRSTSFSLEHDFISAHRKWLSQVRSLLSGLERDMDEVERELNESPEAASRTPDELEDERLEFEAQFRCLLEVMAGVQERVFEACDDWREALGAWGILIQPALKRDDVPAATQIVLKSFPADSTLSHEQILAALAQGEVIRACQLANDYDPWLSAHMTDLLAHIGVLEEEEEDSKTKSFRLKFIEQYAETVLDDQGLWRLAVDYLSYCGPSARRRMRNIVLDVPLIGPRIDVKRAEDVEKDAIDAEMDEQAEDPELAAEERKRKQKAEKVSEEFKTVMDLLQTCVDLGMDLEARAICKKMAGKMTTQKKYGPAIAYCIRANDVRQMKRIADLVLQQYIQEGIEPFCQAVDSIPSSLLHVSAPAEDFYDEKDLAVMEQEGGLPDNFSKVILGSTPSVSSSRLAFLARYRDFHREYAAGNLPQAAPLLVELLSSGVAPESFWAVLLIDSIPLLQETQEDYFTKEQAFEILRVLDQVTSASSIHPRQALHFLGLLEQLLLGPEKGKKLGEQLTAMSDGTHDFKVEQLSFDAKAATVRLDVLRLALARRLARMT